MSDVTEKLRGILSKHPAEPFLFVGSGFSRRYLGLENWTDLLKKFCARIKDFGYYRTKANDNMPKIASEMAGDFNSWWWSAEEAASSREESSEYVKKESDALKIEISKYVRGLSLEKARESEYADELSALSKVSIDGVITTNWDLFLEDLFPDYKVFVGQEDLLFSNPQSIGEIYKIHGSAAQPSTLVLTEEDYVAFDQKNPYLAAKLVTIFVEHPIIFLGYSISDPHIRGIIKSVAGCLSQEKISSFQENLIFIQRVKEGGEPSVQQSTIQFENFGLTMTVVSVSDFSEVYSALSSGRRKIPARLLRFFKEQIYEAVKSSGAEDKKIAVVDYEDIDSISNVEFVVGVGVAEKYSSRNARIESKANSALARVGYRGISIDDIFLDCIKESGSFQAEDLLKVAFSAYAKTSNVFIPVFKYLREVGVVDNDGLNRSPYIGAKKIVDKIRRSGYSWKNYRKRYNDGFSSLSTQEIIDKSSTKLEAFTMIAFQSDDKIDLSVVKQFCLENSEVLGSEDTVLKTAYKKLVCRYDWLAFGFGAS